VGGWLSWVVKIGGWPPWFAARNHTH
jgi:hypothetical protein